MPDIFELHMKSEKKVKGVFFENLEVFTVRKLYSAQIFNLQFAVQ